MDQQILVEGGRELEILLTRDKLDPRAVLWVQSSDTDAWKLWIVPHKSVSDKLEFYREISKLVSEHRSDLGGLDAGDVEMVSDQHPAIKGLKGLLKLTHKGEVRISNTMLNGFYLPDGIILKMDI